MQEKIFHVHNVGDVSFRKNKKSKNVRIAIKPVKGVVVTLPYYVSYRYARNVVERKKDWILNHLPKIREIENEASLFTEETEFYTKYRKLFVIPEKISSVKIIINEEEIIFKYPQNINVKSKEIQDLIKQTIIKALRIEAKAYLTRRTSVLANQLNFKYNKVFIKNNKTLWGSCSGRNNINLNLHLMRLPDHLIDYVIIHELCHTVEKNHGIRFWRLMDSILGDAKSFSKELRSFSIQIY